MNKLFEESLINGLTLKNRFVRAATWEGLATQKGAVTPKLIDMMVSLAKGGVGLIISSHAYVSPEGKGTPWQLGVYSDELFSGLKEMTSAVHKQSVQLIRAKKVLLSMSASIIILSTSPVSPLCCL